MITASDIQNFGGISSGIQLCIVRLLKENTNSVLQISLLISIGSDSCMQREMNYSFDY